MPKGKKKLKLCKECKQLVKRVSRKGYCPDCSIAIQTNSILQLQAKDGKVYEKWKAKLFDGIIKAEKKNK